MSAPRMVGAIIVLAAAACATPEKRPASDDDPFKTWGRDHPPLEGSTGGVQSREGSRTLGTVERVDPCDKARNTLAGLWKTAVLCKADDECTHFPSNCSAIGDNQAADDLVKLTRWHDANCAPEPQQICLGTTPICRQGTCQVRKLPSKLDR